MPRWFLHALGWVLWLVPAFLGGLISVAVIREHGAIGFLIVALCIGFMGAVSTSALLAIDRWHKATFWFRVLVTSVVALIPLPLVWGTALFWPFSAAAAVLSVIVQKVLFRLCKNNAI